MDIDYINSCDGVIFGTPTWVASTCWQMKKWFDVDSRPLKLGGKLGGVYATAHYAQGGADIAIMTLIGHMLVKACWYIPAELPLENRLSISGL